ncbi:hypothetical protein [Streptomyces sp. NPDC091209]|uniref:hypothetical protein n=1 Tax=Streptomyces sp. NPDC091209 TaxID=3365974 RepID=UPI00380A27BC
MTSIEAAATEYGDRTQAQVDAMSRPKFFGSRSILVFQPNPRVYRPEADRCTRGFRLKDFRFL